MKAGMSEPTARKYRRAGKLPSELKASHAWRTRPDPFAEVWSEVEALLEREGGLEAKTVFEELGRRYPLDLTFSCIAPRDGVHCGQCNKCAERQAAFDLIGRNHPTDFACAALGVL